MGKSELVDIDLIRIDGGTQARVSINQEAVEDYAEVYKAEDNLPPVVVFFDGTEYWLADGFHRYHGARKAELAKLNCEVRKGTQRDAILFAVGANQTHGLKRTNADKRKAVGILLADVEWFGMSDRWLADQAGVGVDLVGSCRPQLSDSDSSPEPTKRKGKDGKVRTVKPKTAAKKDPKPSAPKSEPREDGPFADVWAEKPSFDAAIQSLGRLASEVERLWKSPAGAFLHKRRNDVEADFASIKAALKFSAPHKVCPYCKGKGCQMQKGEPTPCMGLGWTPRTVVGDGT